MDSAQIAVLVLAMVAAVGVSLSLSGAIHGDATYLSPVKSTGVCLKLDACQSGWRCCANNQCRCASFDDAAFYRSLLSDKSDALCRTDDYGLLHCVGKDAPAVAPAGRIYPRSASQDAPAIPSEAKEIGTVTEGVFLS